MDINDKLKPFVWNVTYNDPHRWQEVYAISGKRVGGWKGVLETIRGRSIGSPAVQLQGCDGLDEFQHLFQSQTHRVSLNFMRTSAGIIGFCKVRLEVYAIPIRRGEWTFEPQQFAPTSETSEAGILRCTRNGHQIQWYVSGLPDVMNRFTGWLEMAQGS